MPTISQLSAGTTLAGTEVLPIVQSAATVKSTPNAFKTLIAPLTTKGDVLAFSTVNVRVAVGADGTVLTASAAAAPGVAWVSPTTNSLPVRGTAVLVGGTVTVTQATVTASSKIFCTVQALGTVTVAKAVAVTAVVASTSFTITSADATDTSTVAWIIYD